MRGRKSDYRSDEAHGEEGRDADADPGVGPGERRHEDSEELVCETETDHMVELGDVRVVLRENSPAPPTCSPMRRSRSISSRFLQTQ